MMIKIMIIFISRVNYFLSMIKVIMRKFLLVNCEMILISIKVIFIFM